MTLLKTIAKLLKLGPKPEEVFEIKLCADCKWYKIRGRAEDDICLHLECKLVSTPNEAMFVRPSFPVKSFNPSCTFSRSASSKCGPVGKYWEGKVDHFADADEMVCKHTEEEVYTYSDVRGTPSTLRPVLCTFCMRFIKSSAMLAKIHTCKD